MYRIYGFELSYFTRKLEAAFQLTGRPHRRLSKSFFNRRRLERGSGTHQVPVLITPDGDYQKDTTPIMERLGGRSDGTHLFPEGREGILVRLVEEWLDEWFPRAVIHYRWNFEASARWASGEIAKEVMPHVLWPMRSFARRTVAHWGRRAARALAVDTAEGRKDVEQMTRRVLDALEAQLEVTRFALGNRPCAVDAVLLGACRAHLMADPIPRVLFEQYPRIRAWVESPPEPEVGAELSDYRDPNAFAQAILTEWPRGFIPFLRENHRVLGRGERIVTITICGAEVTFLARSYSETSRQNLTHWLNGLEPALGEDLGAWLASNGLNEAFF